MTLDVYGEPFAASGRYDHIGELLPRARGGGATYGTTARPRRPGATAASASPTARRASRCSNRDFNVQSFRSNLVLRWEWRPGSTLYFVWQQDRYVSQAVGTPVGAGDPFRALGEPGNNYFVVKTSFWLPVH